MSTVQDAFIAAVEASLVPLGTVVFDSIVTTYIDADGKRKDPPLQHVVVYPISGERSSGDALCGFRDGRFRFQVTSVAGGVDHRLGRECRGMASRVRDALVGFRLVADGWRCGPIEHEFSNPPVRDEDVLERPTVFATDGYVLLADRLS